VRRTLLICSHDRGFGELPATVDGLVGLSDSYADVVCADGRTNADMFETADFRGRPFDPARDRGLGEILLSIREHVAALGLLPQPGMGPAASLGMCR